MPRKKAKKSKKCRSCEKQRLIEKFSRNSKTADGYLPDCKACMSEKIVAGKAGAAADKPAAKRQTAQVRSANAALQVSNTDLLGLSVDILKLADRLRGRGAIEFKLDLRSNTAELIFPRVQKFKIGGGR